MQKTQSPSRKEKTLGFLHVFYYIVYFAMPRERICIRISEPWVRTLTCLSISRTTPSLSISTDMREAT